MPIKDESYCEGIRKCCCSSRTVPSFMEDIGSSESEDEILNAQIAEIKKVLQPTSKSDTSKSCCSRVCRDLSVAEVDCYFFKYTMWQNMHLGSFSGFKSLDFTLYRFLYAIVGLCLFLFYINIVTDEGDSIGIIYYEAWILFVNAAYASIFLALILKGKFRLYRRIHGMNQEDIEAQNRNNTAAITPLQIRKLQDDPVDHITVSYQICWICLNIFMSAHFALSVVLLAGYWVKRKRTGFFIAVILIHSVHSIGVILEILVCRIPIRISHFIYPIIFTHIYAGYSIAAGYTGKGRAIYLTMNWKANYALSYVRILVFCLIVVGFHLLFYLIFRFREWLVYKVERSRHIYVSHKDAILRRKNRRRIRLNLLLDKCTSEEVFEYVTKHVDLFPEVMTELKDWDPWKKEVMQLREELLAKEDVNVVRERENEKRTQAAKRIKLRIQQRAKQLKEQDEDTEDKSLTGAFSKLMTDIMSAVKERKRQEKEEIAKKEAEAEAGIEKDATGKKREEELTKKHPFPISRMGYIEDYTDYFDNIKTPRPKVLDKNVPKNYVEDPKLEREQREKAISDYDHETRPTNRDSNPNTFSGLSKKALEKRRDAKEKKKKRSSSDSDTDAEADDKTDSESMDEYDLKLAMFKLEREEKAQYPSLDHHIEKTSLWVNPDMIKKSNNQPVPLTDQPNGQSKPIEENKWQKAVMGTITKQLLEISKNVPEPPVSEMVPTPIKRRRKKNPRYDRHGLPPPAPEGTKIVYLEPVPKNIEPDTSLRIPRIPEIRWPQKKWYRIETFEPKQEERRPSKTKSQPPMDYPTHSLMNHYAETVDTRILERIRAKQQAMDEEIDTGMRLKPSGMVGARRKISKALQELRKKDWDLNVELSRYLKVHQGGRDKRIASKHSNWTSHKPDEKHKEISVVTSPESSTASIVPILIVESLTEQDKEKILMKKPGASILLYEPEVEKDEFPPKKFDYENPNPELSKTKEKEPSKPVPTKSEIQFERRAVQIQVRTDTHGPIAGGMYHPLRAPPVKQAKIRTTFHYIDDKLPHSGGLTFVDTEDVAAYANHPGIHVHHPMLHLDKPEGPIPLLKEAIQEQTAKRARLKGAVATGTPAKKKIEYGESQNKSVLRVVAFHPIVQFHSLTQIVTKESSEDLLPSSHEDVDREDSMVDIRKHHEIWMRKGEREPHRKSWNYHGRRSFQKHKHL